MRLSEAAAVTRGELRGRDCLFTGVAIDSRRCDSGDLFVALRGARQDGHDFIAQAGGNGAVGALTCAARRGQVAQIRVADTTAALGRLGAHWRAGFNPLLVAVTGSNGKTTVSALIAAILNGSAERERERCLSPRASFNNHWGVPMTLLRMRAHHTYAVIEMGMNRPGEIAYLSGLAKPDIALINNAASAHLAGLTDVQGVADAKAEIFSGLGRDGIAVLNADDPFHDHWQRGLRRIGVGNTVSFSARGGAQDASIAVSAAAAAADAAAGVGNRFALNIDGQRAEIRLSLPGAHNVANAVAAGAAAFAAGIGIEQIQAGLNAFPGALPGRLALFPGVNGTRIIDDSYNANPASTRAALDVLAGFDGERIAVLGQMAELGARSDEHHRQIGRYAKQCGVRRLLVLGPCGDGGLAGYARGFGAGAEQYDQVDHLLARLAPLMESRAAQGKNGLTILVKGSRAAAMERVVARLAAKSGGGWPC